MMLPKKLGMTLCDYTIVGRKKVKRGRGRRRMEKRRKEKKEGKRSEDGRQG